jgi:predicted Rossmann fold flavoprotein
MSSRAFPQKRFGNRLLVREIIKLNLSYYPTIPYRVFVSELKKDFSVEDHRRVVVVGGGAAGFFAAISAAELNPSAEVVLFEAGNKVLRKVKVSGGGRCNLTHGCFDPVELAKNYPRGSRELKGAFHHWQPRDTIEWFEQAGVRTKIEADGRAFPVSDCSQTIIDCLLGEAHKLGIQVDFERGLSGLEQTADGKWLIDSGDEKKETFHKVCIAAGSLKSAGLDSLIEELGHRLEPLVPSLFAFNVKDPRITGLSGLAVKEASVRTLSGGKAQNGPLLITHRGMSGPAILKLSAWEARIFAQHDYDLEIEINWLPGWGREKIRELFGKLRGEKGDTLVRSKVFEEIPRRLWESLLSAVGVNPEDQWARLKKDFEDALLNELIAGRYRVKGKTTNKEEFVTCGGVSLKEVDFRTMESKLHPGLHFAGECLDLDGITGGFNFQAAWTTGRIAGRSMAGGG